MDFEKTVSVVLLTYNHEAYIRQCLDGIVSQQVSFDYEVVVGDDCSTDNTANILKEYALKYPDIFQLILRKKNTGATRNLYDVLKHCRGKYLAGLEGDDYWIDEKKLQKQFDFMEKHPEYIGCSHEVRMVDEYGQEIPRGKKYFEGCHWGFYKNVYTFKEYERFEMPGQGSTWFYRNIYLEPKFDYSIIETASPMVGDRSVMLILSSQGDWYYMMGEVMTCYRYVTTPGKNSWASWNEVKNRTLVNFELMVNLEKYAKNVLGRKLDLRKFKFMEYHNAVNWCRKQCDPVSLRSHRASLSGIRRLARPKVYFIWKEFTARIHFFLFMPTVEYAILKGELVTDNSILNDSTWEKFEQSCRNRTLVLFGKGLACEEFVRRYGKRFEAACIMDNSKKWKGKTVEYNPEGKGKWRSAEDGFHYVIVSPEVVRDWEKEKFVVLITSSIYQEQMAGQLEEMGFHDYYSLGIMESRRWRYRKLLKGVKDEDLRKGDKVSSDN